MVPDAEVSHWMPLSRARSTWCGLLHVNLGRGLIPEMWHSTAHTCGRPPLFCGKYRKITLFSGVHLTLKPFPWHLAVTQCTPECVRECAWVWVSVSLSVVSQHLRAPVPDKILENRKGNPHYISVPCSTSMLAYFVSLWVLLYTLQFM